MPLNAAERAIMDKEDVRDLFLRSATSHSLVTRLWAANILIDSEQCETIQNLALNPTENARLVSVYMLLPARLTTLQEWIDFLAEDETDSFRQYIELLQSYMVPQAATYLSPVCARRSQRLMSHDLQINMPNRATTTFLYESIRMWNGLGAQQVHSNPEAFKQYCNSAEFNDYVSRQGFINL